MLCSFNVQSCKPFGHSYASFGFCVLTLCSAILLNAPILIALYLFWYIGLLFPPFLSHLPAFTSLAPGVAHQARAWFTVTTRRHTQNQSLRKPGELQAL